MVKLTAAQLLTKYQPTSYRLSDTTKPIHAPGPGVVVLAIERDASHHELLDSFAAHVDAGIVATALLSQPRHRQQGYYVYIIRTETLAAAVEIAEAFTRVCAPQLTDAQAELLQKLCEHVTMGGKGATQLRESRTAYELGLVEFAPDGTLRPTELGVAWVRARFLARLGEIR